MKLTEFLLSRIKIGELTKLYSNLPESYIKRSYEQVYWRTPRGPQYQRKEIKRKNFKFTMHRPWSEEFRQENMPMTQPKKVFMEPVGDWKFFKGDRVEIMTGRDKGKQGIISQVIQERNWVIVEGLNTKLKSMGKTKNFPGIVMVEEMPLLVTNEVKLVDPETLQATEAEWRYTEEGDKVRVSVSTRRIIPMPKQAQETKDYKTKSSYLENPVKDTTSRTVSEITYKPELKTFEMDIMESMNIKEERVPAPTFWY